MNIPPSPGLNRGTCLDIFSDCFLTHSRCLMLLALLRKGQRQNSCQYAISPS